MLEDWIVALAELGIHDSRYPVRVVRIKLRRRGSGLQGRRRQGWRALRASDRQMGKEAGCNEKHRADDSSMDGTGRSHKLSRLSNSVGQTQTARSHGIEFEPYQTAAARGGFRGKLLRNRSPIALEHDSEVISQFPPTRRPPMSAQVRQAHRNN